jgi:hypothetical protein
MAVMRRRLAIAALSLASMGAQAAAERAVGGTAGELLAGLPPAAGLYDAQICVGVGTAPISCGPVTAEVGNAGQTLVRVSDIAYRLQVHADQLGVTLYHGTMQIDGFFARYQWNGNKLLFIDPEKATRYELKLGTRRFDTP